MLETKGTENLQSAGWERVESLVAGVRRPVAEAELLLLRRLTGSEAAATRQSQAPLSPLWPLSRTSVSTDPLGLLGLLKLP